MHLKDIAQNFNISHFLVFCCLLVLSVLLSLQVEGVIAWSYGLIFLPLWVWNALTFTGAAMGVVMWIKRKRQRRDPGHRKYFVGMLQSAILQLVIFVQEILLAINLDLRGRLSWAAIFTPLYVLFVVSIAGCIFSCCIKNCSVELEILGFINILQLIFLVIRLDEAVTWRWAVVLIPTWLLLIGVFVCIVLYACLQGCLLNAEDNRQEAELKRPLLATNIVTFTLATLSFTIFLALLVSQLDGNLSAPYTATFVPLYISILLLLPTTLTRQPANPMWFGLQKNFVEFLLDHSPLFKECLNVSWSKSSGEETRQLAEITAKLKTQGKKGGGGRSNKVASEFVALESKDYPYVNVMIPD